MQHLTTASDVIDALGGVDDVVAICGAKKSTVGMWKTNGLPSNRYCQMLALLHSRGFDAPPSVWSQKP